MRIVIRTDASEQIGTGHVMRCLTLAERLREQGMNISFISRAFPGNLCDFTEKKGYAVCRLPYSGERTVKSHEARLRADLLGVRWETDAEETKAMIEQMDKPLFWLIVDHYALDKQWERQIRPFTRRVMALDDVADRPHDCDLLLDQNQFQNMETRYEGLIPDHCMKLLGPQYALLRPEFQESRRNLRKRDGSVKRILVFFGGSDPTNETTKALTAVAALNRPDIAVDVVVGGANPRRGEIQQMAATMQNTAFHCQVDNMAHLMMQADLFIGAGGSSTWERCCLGLPAIICSIAENQEALAQNAAQAGVQDYLGKSSDVSDKMITRDIRDLISRKEYLQGMANQGMRLVDGAGVDRVARIIGAG